MNPFFIVKRTPTDIPSYRAYVVSVGCIIDDADCNGGIEPNHFVLAAQGGSDSECGGLCSYHHRLFHSLGFEGFVVRYRFDWDKCRARLLEGYFRSIGSGFTPAFTPDRKKRARGKQLQPPTKPCNSRF